MTCGQRPENEGSPWRLQRRQRDEERSAVTFLLASPTETEGRSQAYGWKWLAAVLQEQQHHPYLRFSVILYFLLMDHLALLKMWNNLSILRIPAAILLWWWKGRGQVNLWKLLATLSLSLFLSLRRDSLIRFLISRRFSFALRILYFGLPRSRSWNPGAWRINCLKQKLSYCITKNCTNEN